MKLHSWPPQVRWLLEVVVLAAVYFAAAKLGLSLSFAGTNVSPVWPPTGVALAAILLLGYRVWPGIWLGAFLANVTTFATNDVSLSTAVLTSTIIGAGNTLEAVIGAFLIRRFVGERHPLDQIQDTFKFILFGVLLAPVASATIGVAGLIIGRIAATTISGYLWWTWWLGDALGALIIAPVILVMATERWPHWPWRRWGEALLLLGLLVTATWLIFEKSDGFVLPHYHLEYLLIPFVVLITFRFGQLGTTLSTLLVAAITVRCTALGHGLFALDSINDSLLLLQTYLAVFGGLSLVLAGAVTERDYKEAELRLHQVYLEEIVDERTAELTQTNAQLAKEINERQQAEAVLRQSETRFKGLVERNFDVVAVLDAAGHLTYVSPSIKRVGGFEPQDMVGHAFLEFFTGSDQAKAKQTFDNVLQGEIIEGLVLKALNIYNSPTSIELNCAPIYEDEKIVGVQAVYRDVSDQQRAEKLLLESKKMLQLIMDSIPQSIFWKDTDSVYLGCNLNFAWAAGVENSEEIVGKTDYDLAWKKEEADAFRADDCEVMDNDWPKLHIIEPQRQVGGKQAWLETNKLPLHDEDGNVAGVLGTFEDITERLAMENALRERNRELSMLNEASRALSSSLDVTEVLEKLLQQVHRLPDVLACSVWLIDPESGEVVCREATEPRRQAVYGWRLAPGEGLVGWVIEHKQSLNVPDVLADERHFKGVDKKTGLDLRSILTVPLQVKQKVIGVMQVVDEEPDRFGETHQTLLESLAATAAIAIQNAQWYEQARQDAETKLALFHEVNHRVKNNLTAIIGLLYAERRHATMEGRTYRDIINTLISRIQGLATVHELLSAAEWRPLPLSDLTQQVINTVLQILPNQQVSVDVSPSSVEVSPTQANQLALIVNELTTNAMKYAFVERENGKLSARITADDSTIHFEFRDDGPGYPDDVLRLERQNVGLYLIQTLVQSGLQGELRLYNDNGAVTAIDFKLMQ